MDKLLAMEEQLKQNVGATTEEGMGKFKEAMDYVREHMTPEVRERMKQFVCEGMDKWGEEMKALVTKLQDEGNEEELEKVYRILEEFKK